MTILYIVIALVPISLYVMHQLGLMNPSKRWPVLATSLKLSYDDDPPRITGDRGGRRVQIVAVPAGVTCTMWLKKPTYLRVECGPKDAVNRRAGAAVSDAAPVLDEVFGKKYLGRCSDAEAAGSVFDAALQIRVSDMAEVDFVGNDASVIWSLPALKELAEAESVLGALTAVSEGLERFAVKG